jgi:hypothetical protein
MIALLGHGNGLSDSCDEIFLRTYPVAIAVVTRGPDPECQIPDPDPDPVIQFRLILGQVQ